MKKAPLGGLQGCNEPSVGADQGLAAGLGGTSLSGTLSPWRWGWALARGRARSGERLDTLLGTLSAMEGGGGRSVRGSTPSGRGEVEHPPRDAPANARRAKITF